MTIGNLIRNHNVPFVSFEFFPPKDEEACEAFFEEAAKLHPVNPLFASVTYGAGGNRQDNTLAVVTRLKNMGFEPMSHLTCVNASKERINTYLEELINAGINNVLALRGDPPSGAPAVDWTKAPFAHASDLVRHIRTHFPDMGLGVAGYPSPHPESPSFASDHFYTALKIREGADFVVTQMFFDVREYFAFVDRLRFMGITVPVIPGVMPIQSFASLKRILSLSDSKIPGKLYLALEEADAKGGPEAVREAGVRYAVAQIRALIAGGAPGVHLYSLNKAEMCLRIIDESGLLNTRATHD